MGPIFKRIGNERDAQRYLIEPLSETTHIKSILIKRFLTFLDQIRKSTKTVSKFLLNSILLDANSVTGFNLCNILLRTDKASIHDFVPNDAFQTKYHQIHPQEEWRLRFIEEILEIKNTQLLM